MHISLSHHSIDHLRQELEKLFLHVPLPLNFNNAYFTGHQGILICACINRTRGDLQKATPLCMNELCIVLSAVAITSYLEYTVTMDFKEVTGSTRIQ